MSGYICIPVCDVAVADTLHVPEARAPQQAVFAGVQRQQQVAHPVGVVDGLAEHRALLLLHTLSLQFLGECRPQSALLRRQLQGADLPPTSWAALLLLRTNQKNISDESSQVRYSDVWKLRIHQVNLLSVLCFQVQSPDVVLDVTVEHGLPELHSSPHRVLLYTAVGKLCDACTHFLLETLLHQTTWNSSVLKALHNQRNVKASLHS